MRVISVCNMRRENILDLWTETTMSVFFVLTDFLLVLLRLLLFSILSLTSFDFDFPSKIPDVSKDGGEKPSLTETVLCSNVPEISCLASLDFVLSTDLSVVSLGDVELSGNGSSRCQYQCC